MFFFLKFFNKPPYLWLIQKPCSFTHSNTHLQIYSEDTVWTGGMFVQGMCRNSSICLSLKKFIWALIISKSQYRRYVTVLVFHGTLMGIKTLQMDRQTERQS